MKSDTGITPQAGERGAVKIQTVLTFVLIAIIAFVVIKIAPVYIEQRSIQYEVYELARKSAVGSYKKDEVKRRIDRILSEYSLPPDSLTIEVAADKAQLSLKYIRTIDFLVTQYDWTVEYKDSIKSL